MIRLALVRHAKSDWGDPALDDHDRPLNDRGRRDAPVMAERLAQAGFRPEVILSSSAVRARTTAAVFGERLGVDVDIEPRLYGASAPTLLAHAADAAVPSVLLVAHDPGMSVLAGRLSRDRIEHMPTCAVATFHWDEDDWSLIDAVDPVEWTFDTPR
jgi:phosphohistidine phosphatase